MGATLLRRARLGLAFLGRDWRSGELRLLALSLVLAVGAMTSVGFFADRLHQGLERDAGQLLAADLVLISDGPVSDTVRTQARADGLAVADTVAFPSMALAQDSARLAAVKAVSAGYPLRGTLRIAPAPGVPDHATHALPGPHDAWVEPELLSALHLKVGDAVHLGDSVFTIKAVLTQEPDRGLTVFNIAPRILIGLDDLAATHLIQTGSRETRRVLFSGSASAVAAFQPWLEAHLSRGQHLETLAAGRPEVRATLDRAQQFLALVALLAALLAAVAIALAARRFSERHLDGCAVMRCLGASQADLVALYACEFVCLGVVGAAFGVALGYGAHYVFIELLGRLLETQLPAPHAGAALQGFLVGFVLLVGFALPPVLQLRHVPPLRVLRRDLGTPRASAALGYATGVVLFAALLFWTAHDLKVGAITAGGFAGSFLIFGLVAYGALRGVGMVRHRANLPPALRFALASMQRRPVATVVQTVALAFGLTALLLLSVTRTDLVTAWRHTAPPDAPNRFVINLQPDQVADFKTFLAQSGIGTYDLYPMIRGRLVAVNGRPVGPATYQDEQAKRLVEREFNLSDTTQVPVGNQITSGRWFDGGRDEISMEEGIAKTLGIKLGDRLRFDVAGQTVEAPVTSLRKLQWDSMHVNFFVILPPRSVADLPRSWISAFHLEASQSGVADRLVEAFPNATVIDMGAVLHQIQTILDQVVTAVEFLFVFTLAAGVLVLYAALMSSRDERGREAALLRALGASRRQLSRSQFAEFAGLGLLAGLLAAAAAVAIGWALAVHVFNFPFHFEPMPWIAGALGGIAVTVLGGWLGLRPVLRQPPLVSLREV